LIYAQIVSDITPRKLERKDT